MYPIVARGTAFVSAIVLLLSLMTVTLAQESDLDATIRAAILSDPRSSQMTEAEIDAMVAALSQEAESQGVTPEDITWRPQDPATFDQETSTAEGCGYPAFICALNDAFGFSGYPLLIPLLLGITSALLLFVIGSILLHIHGHHPIRGLLSRNS
ncbi:hypothetical protein HY414_02735 [Candidatus Kaiserbacteria bacterium]|nr:hypothetical protein [Candidatus Kaiserbacteria bacterium]